MDRMIQANVIAMSGRAVEAAGDVDVLLLDKTGTITLGNRQAVELIPAPGVQLEALADAAQLASLADETPEGRSIVVLAKQKFGLRARDIEQMKAHFVPFSATTRMSGVDLDEEDGSAAPTEGTGTGTAASNRRISIPSGETEPPGESERPIAAHVEARCGGNGHTTIRTPTHREIRKGAAEAIDAYVRDRAGQIPLEVRRTVEDIARRGGTPLVVAEAPQQSVQPGDRATPTGEPGGAMVLVGALSNSTRPGAPPAQVLGVIHLKDIVKGGMKERFVELRQMGIKTVMITGDNPLTAAAIAAEAGVDDFLAEATPEAKLSLIRNYQKGGRLVAMTGDGTNDSPALAQADVAVAMNSGTQAAKEAGNMVDLDSNPTKLIEIVEIGKQLLITRGALTTFSLANDVSKYFAIIPAAFASTYPVLDKLNIMRLATPSSAILSAVIFNALIIVILIPLALRGVKYRAVGAARLLRDNLLIYGLGGLIVPFIGIKLIDLILVAFGLGGALS
jgi:K+-transporting ATPase ATPase B chain